MVGAAAAAEIALAAATEEEETVGEEAVASQERAWGAQARAQVRALVAARVAPELLNRMDEVVVFESLRRQVLWCAVVCYGAVWYSVVRYGGFWQREGTGEVS